MEQPTFAEDCVQIGITPFALDLVIPADTKKRPAPLESRWQLRRLCETPPMILDLSSLRNAIAQTEEALAAAIQAFEFTYELAIKTLRRYLMESEPSPATVDEMSFNDLVRRGYAIGLLQAELTEWKVYRRSRGITEA